MLEEQKLQYSEMNSLLLKTVLRKMTDAEFSTIAKLSITDEELFNNILRQKITAELTSMIISKRGYF